MNQMPSLSSEAQRGARDSSQSQVSVLDRILYAIDQWRPGARELALREMRDELGLPKWPPHHLRSTKILADAGLASYLASKLGVDALWIQRGSRTTPRVLDPTGQLCQRTRLEWAKENLEEKRGMVLSWKSIWQTSDLASTFSLYPSGTRPISSAHALVLGRLLDVDPEWLRGEPETSAARPAVPEVESAPQTSALDRVRIALRAVDGTSCSTLAAATNLTGNAFHTKLRARRCYDQVTISKLSALLNVDCLWLQRGDRQTPTELNEAQAAEIAIRFDWAKENTEERLGRALTWTMVGSACDVCPTTLSSYRAGRRPMKPEHADAVATYLQVNSRWLAGIRNNC